MERLRTMRHDAEKIRHEAVGLNELVEKLCNLLRRTLSWNRIDSRHNENRPPLDRLRILSSQSRGCNWRVPIRPSPVLCYTHKLNNMKCLQEYLVTRGPSVLKSMFRNRTSVGSIFRTV